MFTRIKTFILFIASFRDKITYCTRQFLQNIKTKSQIRANKYGVMVTGWKTSISIPVINIGDDIQALAQIKVLRQFGIKNYRLINRENLKDYDKEPVKMIMNGWYMHHINQFPPAPNITPILTSVHIATDRLVPNNKPFWLQHQPIGCRDNATLELFKKHGINEVYLSKCLTLMFDRYKGKREGIYLVDVDLSQGAIYEDFLKTIPNRSQMQKIAHVLTAKGYPHLLWNKEKNGGDTGTNHLLGRADKLLNLYRKAELIITTRLHCALPSRAFGTPVIFVNKNYATDSRFKGLEDILNGSDGSVPYPELDPHLDYSIIEKVQKKFIDNLSKYIK